jgi:hypothetical protein
VTFSLTINLLFVLGVVGGALGIIDGVTRARGRSAILGILQIIAAALFVLSLFVTGVPLGSVLLAFIAIILLIVGLAIGHSRRGTPWLAVIGIILLVAWLVLGPRAIVIPGINA